MPVPESSTRSGEREKDEDEDAETTAFFTAGEAGNTEGRERRLEAPAELLRAVAEKMLYFFLTRLEILILSAGPWTWPSLLTACSPLCFFEVLTLGGGLGSWPSRSSIRR